MDVVRPLLLSAAPKQAWTEAFLSLTGISSSTPRNLSVHASVRQTNTSAEKLAVTLPQQRHFNEAVGAIEAQMAANAARKAEAAGRSSGMHANSGFDGTSSAGYSGSAHGRRFD